ncbi:hypothetical protein [Rhizobium sp. N324]|uniref:hypothetical protein n=1 Tax=Rhizobium sp. N324 TaxID=1703969 RepID=UPI0007EABBA3|nr:hypothetical protein [Rhizobium sp. N324]ANM12062.1 hypothetical protein AMK05_CH03713 [Rhizobium sp. N324]
MADDLDLFGNPYHSAGRGQGRPEHVPTEENIINVMVLLASGMKNGEVAKIVGLSTPTLRKHYFHLLKQRDVMAARLKGRLRTAQIQQGLGGNAAALSGALKMLDAVTAEKVNRDMQSKAANKPVAKGYVSKKEQRLDNARAISGGGRYAVPAGPRLIANNGQPVASGDET